MSRLGVAITWLGHSAFHLRAEPDGASVLIDPWLGNPRAPANAQELASNASLIVVTHGHDDHTTGVAALARKTGATIAGSYDLMAEFLADGVPESQLLGFNKGGTVKAAGVSLTLTQAQHSSTVIDANGRPRGVGEPCGVIIDFGNGTVIYDTSDTCVFGDMALIAELYRPTILMLSIGDHFTMGPREAAKACELVDPDWIIPHHYGTFPLLTGTPEALREKLRPTLRDRLLGPAPGETVR